MFLLSSFAEVNTCEPINPCMNEGVCTQVENSLNYTCACAAGFNETLCENSKHFLWVFSKKKWGGVLLFSFVFFVIGLLSLFFSLVVGLESTIH